MSKVPANFIGLSTTIGIQQPIGTYGGQIYLQKWCQPMVFPDVLYWPINYYHRYLKTYRHLCCLQKWCQPMVEIVFPDVVVVDDVLVVEFAVFSQSISAGLGDVSATSRGVVDDVASKLAAGGSYWVPTSSVGAGDDVWVLISRFWGSSCCGWLDFSVWVPVVS